MPSRDKLKTYDAEFWKYFAAFVTFVTIICFIPFFLTQKTWLLSIGTDKPNEIGDAIGGTLGPLVGIAASALTFLAFWVQYKANQQQRHDLEIERFESKYFEMIRMLRENASELEFELSTIEKNKNGDLDFQRQVYADRHVFYAILKQYSMLSIEINPFITDNSIFLPAYLNKLQSSKRIDSLNIPLFNFARIDICYSILYYGVGSEGIIILRTMLREKYDPTKVEQLLEFIRLKPKDDRVILSKWNLLLELDHEKRLQVTSKIYEMRLKDKPNLADFSAATTIEGKIIQGYHNSFTKFYGGHQFRLGHYFRHLFQTIKFVNNLAFLEYIQKYEYVKMLRAQLSTSEQSLLFVNSISSMGMPWEMIAEPKDPTAPYALLNAQLITKYNLIKNIPGNTVQGIPFKSFYPTINYEGLDGMRDEKHYY